MPAGATVDSWHLPPPWDMSGSVALQQPGSIITKGQVDMPGLCCCQVHVDVCEEGCEELSPPLPWT